MKKNKTQLSLLPSYFKNISVGLAALGILLMLTTFLFAEQWELSKDIFIPIGKHLFLLSLLFLAFSREKIETEAIAELRFKHLSSAVIFGTVLFIFDSSIELFYSTGNRTPKTGYEVLLIILVYYLVSFHFYKNNKR